MRREGKSTLLCRRTRTRPLSLAASQPWPAELGQPQRLVLESQPEGPEDQFLLRDKHAYRLSDWYFLRRIVMQDVLDLVPLVDVVYSLFHH